MRSNQTTLERADLGEIAEDSAGTIGGEAHFSFQGNSMAAVMANLDGSAKLSADNARRRFSTLVGGIRA